MTTLQALITKLGSAEEGSRELDGLIALTLGWTHHPLGLWRDETGQDVTTDEGVPHFSTSLDASLPGENIGAVVRDHRTGAWQAVHIGETGYGHTAKAKTEILARRLACLKAMADE